MREIKFRAWNGEGMDYGGFSIHATGQIKPHHVAPWIADDAPVMQYTGLNDREGGEIYEGDILEHTVGLCVVKFDSGCFYADDPAMGRVIAQMWPPFWKIIGNIYQNPELLNG